MRRICLLLFLVAVAGCGGGPESKLLGTWNVDPASVSTTRLAPGAQNKPDWADAVEALAKVHVTFAKDGVVTANGFGESSPAKWKLMGTAIQVDGGNETWPGMVFDPNSMRVHLTYEKGADTLRMDLVKSG
jgi:hypothetical protein